MSHALPVNKDGFSYAGESLYVETSGAHRHRRATMPEIREIFQPTGAVHSFTDPVGHWYEAQLLHYGLSPSKSKAVAKTRLLDAFNRGSLIVPKSIERVEAELKKEWAKQEREARAELSKEKKRKATSPGVGRSGGIERNINISINVGASSERMFESSNGAPPAAKRARTTPAKSMVDKSSVSSRQSQRPIQTARRGVSSSPRGSAARGSQRPIQTARRGVPFSPGGSASGESHRSIQTARRSVPFSPRGRATRGRGSTLEREPNSIPPKHEPNIKRESTNALPPRSFDPTPDDYKSEADEYKVESQRRLGLLNGRYEINCPDLEQWDQFDGYEFSLILTLDGNALWGAYDFGMFSGIFHLPQRPWEASDTAFEFNWRGRENSEGMMSFGDDRMGWIKFLGDGEIEGVITVCGEAKFAGMRVSGGETRSERDARSMRQEWDGYNERAYEEENASRWHNSSW